MKNYAVLNPSNSAFDVVVADDTGILGNLGLGDYAPAFAAILDSELEQEITRELFPSEFGDWVAVFEDGAVVQSHQDMILGGYTGVRLSVYLGE
jgi:hypothetical protein